MSNSDQDTSLNSRWNYPEGSWFNPSTVGLAVYQEGQSGPTPHQSAHSYNFERPLQYNVGSHSTSLGYWPSTAGANVYAMAASGTNCHGHSGHQYTVEYEYACNAPSVSHRNPYGRPAYPQSTGQSLQSFRSFDPYQIVGNAGEMTSPIEAPQPTRDVVATREDDHITAVKETCTALWREILRIIDAASVQEDNDKWRSVPLRTLYKYIDTEQKDIVLKYVRLVKTVFYANRQHTPYTFQVHKKDLESLYTKVSDIVPIIESNWNRAHRKWNHYHLQQQKKRDSNSVDERDPLE